MAADPATGGFGRKLREARERRGISLRQIASATKISIGQLEALEHNHISRLPGGIFSRAFVRAYSIEVGLDPDETIQEFIAQFANDSVTAGHPTSEQGEDNIALESDRRMASASLRLIALSLAIAGLMIYYTAGRGGSRVAAPVPHEVAGSRSEPAQEVAASFPVDPALQEDPPSMPEPALQTDALRPASVPPGDVKSTTDLLTVGVVASGPCWVSAVVDGETVIQRELAAGERQVLEVRRELVLTAGDGAALTLTLNGADARPLGKAGEVVTTRVSLANFKEYLASR